jgi:Na+/melibiose symporter-like transporter
VLSITTLSILVFAIIEAPSRGWLDPVVLGAFFTSAVLGTLFIWQELRSDHAMLNLDFFKNPRFSAGSGAITTTFFAMFGVIFILTQYLQFVHGYTALQAGIRISPFAIGMMVGAANSHRLVRKLGTNKVVAGGMILLALMLASFSLWDVATSYWVILVSLILMSFGMANAMAPSTDAVMGAVPLAKAGVGSAMNDTTRMVGGALGVAIIGSIMNSIYTSNMATITAALPSQAAEAARDSVGAAIAVGDKIGGPQGEALVSSARAEFVNAMGYAFIAAAGVALVGSMLVLKFMPPEHLGSQEATPTPGPSSDLDGADEDTSA